MHRRRGMGAWSGLQLDGPVDRPAGAAALHGEKMLCSDIGGTWRHVIRRARLHPQRFLRLHSGGDAGLWFHTFLRRLALAVASFSERPWPESGPGGGHVHAEGELDLRRLGFLREEEGGVGVQSRHGFGGLRSKFRI
jgi:hypothetical protein